MAIPLPRPRPNWALFLDFDGTLVEIVERPEAVRLEPSTRAALAALNRALGGALALVSGRRIADLDGFVGLDGLAMAGLHGLERREPGGAAQGPPAQAAIAALRPRLEALIARHRGARLEDKGASLAVHWRGAPEIEQALASAVRAAAEDLEGVVLVPGKMVLEARPAGGGKGAAIAAFLERAPFAGRVPVFAGDDVTDEDGFAEIEQRGGITIKIGEGDTRARYRVGSVAAFGDWLVEAAGEIAPPAPPADAREKAGE